MGTTKHIVIDIDGTDHLSGSITWTGDQSGRSAFDGWLDLLRCIELATTGSDEDVCACVPREALIHEIGG